MPQQHIISLIAIKPPIKIDNRKKLPENYPAAYTYN